MKATTFRNMNVEGYVILVLMIFNEGAYLTFKSNFHKGLDLN